MGKLFDISGIVGTILMGLSKAFDCLIHELLIAKMEAYGFSLSNLKYLKKSKHRVHVGSEFNDWLELILDVPQGSILGHVYLTFLLTIFSYFSKKLDYVILPMNTLYIHVTLPLNECHLFWKTICPISLLGFETILLLSIWTNLK